MGASRRDALIEAEIKFRGFLEELHCRQIFSALVEPYRSIVMPPQLSKSSFLDAVRGSQVSLFDVLQISECCSGIIMKEHELHFRKTLGKV